MAAGRGVALLVTLAMLAATAAWAADDVVARAMQLYDKRHYRDAARTLETALPSLDPGRQATASLTLGIVYLGTAELHRELSQSATPIQLEYLKAIAAIRGPGASRLASFYLGQTLLESGRPADAIKVLERFAAEPGVEPGLRAQAMAHLGLAHFLRKDAATARALWNSLEARDPQTKATLAAVYSRAGITEPAPVALADAVLKDIGERPAALVRQKLIGVYPPERLAATALPLPSTTNPQAPCTTTTPGHAQVT